MLSAPTRTSRWLRAGLTTASHLTVHRDAPSGARGAHGFDLTFCAAKSISLVRALRADDVVSEAIAHAHATALAEAMKYLAAHAGYTRVHNPTPARRAWCACPAWPRLPISMRRRAAEIQTFTPM